MFHSIGWESKKCLTENWYDSFGMQCSVAIGNPERHVRKASHCGSKQQ